jgi:hypothetical protein
MENISFCLSYQIIKMTVAIIRNQPQKVQKMTSMEVMKKMNKIIQSLKDCDQRFMIHEFVNQAPEEEMGNYIECVFEARTETKPPKIIGAKISKYIE